MHRRIDSDDRECQILLQSKSGKGKIKNIRVLNINSSLHLFYLIDYTKSMLVHQIINFAGTPSEPQIIDTICKRCVYDVTDDSYGNIHIIYKTETSLKYRKYQNSSKSYTSCKTIADLDITDISSVVYKDRLYVAYVGLFDDMRGLYFWNDSANEPVRITSLSSMRVRCAIFIKSEKAVIHWVENSMAFEAITNNEYTKPKISSLGRSVGIHRVKNSSSSYCCAFNLKEEPYCMGVIKTENEESKFKEKGYEVKELSLNYAKALDEKRTELKEEFFMQSLAKIEKSLNNLTELCQKILVSCDNKEEDEYNEINDFNRKDDLLQ